MRLLLPCDVELRGRGMPVGGRRGLWPAAMQAVGIEVSVCHRIYSDALEMGESMVGGESCDRRVRM